MLVMMAAANPKPRTHRSRRCYSASRYSCLTSPLSVPALKCFYLPCVPFLLTAHVGVSLEETGIHRRYTYMAMAITAIVIEAG